MSNVPGPFRDFPWGDRGDEAQDEQSDVQPQLLPPAVPGVLHQHSRYSVQGRGGTPTVEVSRVPRLHKVRCLRRQGGNCQGWLRPSVRSHGTLVKIMEYHDAWNACQDHG